MCLQHGGQTSNSYQHLYQVIYIIASHILSCLTSCPQAIVHISGDYVFTNVCMNLHVIYLKPSD